MRTVPHGASAPLAASSLLLLLITTSLLACCPAFADPDCLDYATNPEYPLLGSVVLPDGFFAAGGIHAMGGYAYAVAPFAITFPSGQMFVIALSDPAHPTIVGTGGTYHPIAVVANGDHAFVSDKFGSGPTYIRAFDVNPPTATTQVSQHDAWGGDLALVGNYLYEGRNDVFEVTNVTDPAAPVTAGTLYQSMVIHRIAAVPGYVYMAGFQAGVGTLFVVDVSDPTDPVIAGTYLHDSAAHFQTLALRDHFAVVRTDGLELVTIDVSDPTAPALLSRVTSQAYRDIAFDDAGFLYALGDRLFVYDFSDPTQPQLIGSTNAPASIASTPRMAIGSHIYFLRQSGPLQLSLDVIPRQCPLTTSVPPTTPAIALAFAQPNPFRGQTEIHYELAQSGVVRLSVFDVAGRLVRELGPAAHGNAGSQAVIWDGRNAAGRAVAPGAYYVRIAVAGEKDTDQRTFVRITALD